MGKVEIVNDVRKENSMNNNMNAARWFGMILKVLLAGVCAVFIGSESLAFFEFVFPADKWYLAYTGFGLTMGAFLVYLFLLLKDAHTPLQKVIALLMMVVGLAGELATAGFGMMIEGWAKLGWQPKPEDYDFMILVIRIAMGIHGVALVAYSFGDTIIELMGDQDGDGIPNVIDSDYKPAPKPKQNKGSIFGGLFGKRQPHAIVQNNAVVGQPRIDMSGFTSEQIFELAKRAQEMAAQNQQGSGVPVNGNGHTVDPTHRPSQ
jgi:hypothetical protein